MVRIFTNLLLAMLFVSPLSVWAQGRGNHSGPPQAAKSPVSAPTSTFVYRAPAPSVTGYAVTRQPRVIIRQPYGIYSPYGLPTPIYSPSVYPEPQYVTVSAVQ